MQPQSTFHPGLWNVACMLRAGELGKLSLLIVLIRAAVLMFQCLIADNNNSNKEPSLPQVQTESKQ